MPVKPKSPKSPKKSRSPTKKQSDAPLPASSMGAMSAQAGASLSSIKMPSQLRPVAMANVDERAAAAFAAMNERRRMLRVAGGDAATEIHGESGMARELAAWAKARAGREEATEARIEALHYSWTASLPTSRPNSGRHRAEPSHAPHAPPGGGRSGSAAIAPGRLRPTSAPIASRLNPAGVPGRHRPLSAAARSYRREPTAWRLHVRDVTVIGISDLLKSKREPPTPSAQKMGFGSSSMARSGVQTKLGGKSTAPPPPGELRVVVRALWSNERAMTAALPAGGSDELAWRGVGVALSLPASGGRDSAAEGGAERPGSGKTGRPGSGGLGGRWAQAGDETVSVELWEVRKRSDGGVDETQLASGTTSMPINGRAQAAYGGQITVQLSRGRPALTPSRGARASGPAEQNGPCVSFAWRAEGQTRREVERGWSDNEEREADLSEESQESEIGSDGSREGEEGERIDATHADGGASVSGRGGVRRQWGGSQGADVDPASPGGAGESENEHALADLSMSGMGIAQVWDAEAGKWRDMDITPYTQTAARPASSGAGAEAHGGGGGAPGGPAGWAEPTVYASPTQRRPRGGEEGSAVLGGNRYESGRSVVTGGSCYVTELREGALGPHDPFARTPADGAAKAVTKPAVRPVTAAGKPLGTAKAKSAAGGKGVAGRKGAVGGAAGLSEPPLEPEAARFRHRPASAPSARLLTQMDELARIKAAFARQNMPVDMRAFERALLAPDDRPAEMCLRALPRQGSRAMPLDRFLPAHLQPPPKPATRKKSKKGKKK